MKSLYKIIVVLLLLPAIYSCKKFVVADPPKSEIASSTVFTSDATALAAISNIYATMVNGYAGGSNASFTYHGSLSADELDLYNTNTLWKEFADANISVTNTRVDGFWLALYQQIYRANLILEMLSKSTEVTAAVKNQLEGEAKFIRAFSHFYLVNMFGDVPLALTTDYRVNAVIPRTAQAQVHQQIVLDLKDAQNILSDNYAFAGNQRVRPTKWAAAALLARVYLYTQDWPNAEIQATTIINQQALFQLSALNGVFLKNSTEAILQLIRDNNNAADATTFIVTGTTPANSALKQAFVDKFESLDQRKTAWIASKVSGLKTYFYPVKYKITATSPVSEYSMVLRLAEQYLIRAEARIQQPGKINEGIADLNVIRSRASLPAPNDLAKIALNLSKADAMAALERERALELFTEWGNRWLDLKRWPSLVTPGDGNLSRADDVLKVIKPGWTKEDKLYPIPLAQINNDPAMKDAQNPGYQ